MKETCQNCKHLDGCLLRGVIIYNLFILTGRDESVAEARRKINVRPSCGSQWEADERRI